MNSKNRKLRFIRTKNKLRRGIVKFVVARKVSAEYFESGVYEVKISTKEAIKELLRNYKLKYAEYPNASIEYQVGECGEDILTDLLTVSTTICLVDRFKPKENE